jgi:hypothetical protein
MSNFANKNIFPCLKSRQGPRKFEKITDVTKAENICLESSERSYFK